MRAVFTGTWSVFGEGIKNNRQQQQHKAEQAAAEANKKSGFVGKTMGMGKNLLFTTNSTKANGTGKHQDGTDRHALACT